MNNAQDMQQKRNIILGICGALCLASPAFAAPSDPRIEGAKLCTRNLAHYERQYGIPMHLLSAISSTESGRYHDGLKMTLPWPWTINVEGEGHYYDTKEEAVAAVKRYKMQGARSIDVGCMQVSLLHHPDAFANLEEAFDPEHNVAYGASFLRRLYDENKSWKQASSDYHSKTPSRGSEYVSVVYDRWTNIIKRLREAKAAIPSSTMAALNEPTPVAKTVALFMPKTSSKKDEAPKQLASNMRSKTRMNSISIRAVDDVARDRGVLVLHPKIEVVDEPIVSAAANNTASPIVPIVSAEASPIVPLEKSPPVMRVAEAKPAPAKAAGPHFIFEN